MSTSEVQIRLSSLKHGGRMWRLQAGKEEAQREDSWML